MDFSSWSPNSKLETPLLHSGAAYDRSETTKTPKFHQFPRLSGSNPRRPLQIKTAEIILLMTRQNKILRKFQTRLASQTSPPKGTQLLNYVVATEQPPRNQTGNEPVPFLNCSNNRPTDIQNSEQHVTTTPTGDTTYPPLTMTSLIEEGLVRDEQTNEVYLLLTSPVVLKRKQQMLLLASGFRQ